MIYPGVIGQILNPTAELLIPMGIPTKDVQPEMEIHPVTVETKISMDPI